MFLSIMGMYEYDNTLFDGLTLPSGINKEHAVNEICLQCGEMEVVYPDFNTMKLAIKIWSDSNTYTWDKLYKSMNLDYNPIWNVDAHETESFVQSKDNSVNRKLTENKSVSSKDKTSYDSKIETAYDSSEETTYDSTEEKTLDLTNTESVKGFNSTSWASAKQVENDGTDTTDHTGTDTVDHSGKDTVTRSGNDTVDFTETDKIDHTGVDTGKENTKYDIIKERSGNIGVTTTQKMISEEREIAEFNIINYIVQSFKVRFCILVY